MTFKEIQSKIISYIEEPVVNFEIEKQIFEVAGGRKRYNRTIRKNVEAKYGVYVWVNKLTEEVVYIGMAGKVKTDGTLSNHSIQNRLLASRGRDKVTKKDLQTNDYISMFMTNNNIDSLNFFILYSKQGEAPAYIEALMLYNYYKKNKKLPILNNSF